MCSRHFSKCCRSINEWQKGETLNLSQEGDDYAIKKTSMTRPKWAPRRRRIEDRVTISCRELGPTGTLPFAVQIFEQRTSEGSRDREERTEIFHLLVHCPNSCGPCSLWRLKPEVQKSLLVSSKSSRNLSLLTIPCCFPGCLLAGNWNHK